MGRPRRSGVLLHISSLPGTFGSGDFGNEAFDFAKRISSLGFSLWQTLPLTPVSEAFGCSPYCGGSAFAGNVIFVSPDMLMGEGLLTEEEIKPWICASGRKADFAGALECRKDLLKTAWHRMRDDSARFAGIAAEFEAFCAKEAPWLKDYALFVLLKGMFGQKCWTEWPRRYAKREEDALAAFEIENKEALELISFEQFVFFRQLAALSQHCLKLGVELMGDIPIYVAWDSADVWRHPEYFDLSEDGAPRCVAGVPPDYFSATGQRWGNPLYDWDKMREDGFSWWLARMSGWLRYFRLMRIDHFRGLCAYWAIPADEPTAVNGEWRPAAGREMLEAFMEHETPGTDVPALVAEDLGIITDDVRGLMSDLGLPGMKVLMFAFGGDTGTNPYAPHNIDENSVVYTGTHDNDTVSGWWRKSASERERAQLSLYCGCEINEANAAAVMTRLALASRAELAVIPVQDLLGLDESCRMNEPSKVSGSWIWRLEPEQMTSLYESAPGFTGQLKELNAIYGRCAGNL